MWLYVRLDPALCNLKNAHKQMQVYMHTETHTLHCKTSGEFTEFAPIQKGTANERLTGQKWKKKTKKKKKHLNDGFIQSRTPTLICVGTALHLHLLLAARKEMAQNISIKIK